MRKFSDLESIQKKKQQEDFVNSMKKCLSGEQNEPKESGKDKIHPRMIYEIMNKIKQNGSINSSEIVQLIAMFEDVNQQQPSDGDCVKYMKFGLEALVDTVQRQREGHYDKSGSLLFSQKTTDLKSSNRSRAVTSEEGKLFAFGSGLKKSYGTESSNSLTKADKIKERLRASKMSERKDGFEGISLQQSIYMNESAAVEKNISFNYKKGLNTQRYETHQDTYSSTPAK